MVARKYIVHFPLTKETFKTDSKTRAITSVKMRYPKATSDEFEKTWMFNGRVVALINSL